MKLSPELRTQAKQAANFSERAVRILAAPLLVLLAFVYYSAYFNSGLNLGGEGGTTAVIAMRLMEGQRPIADTFLGYNVLWFFPVVWLFQMTGPDYLALRFFFFAICTVTGLFSWLVVFRVTRSGWLGLLAGIAAILIPGMLFRNYMAWMAVVNQLAMVSAFLLPVKRPWHRVVLVGLSGAVLGITFLIRIEVGLFMSVIWVGLTALACLVPGRPFAEKAKISALGFAAGMLCFAIVHVPFVQDAHRRGYAEQFYSQYTGFVGLFRWEIQKLLPKPAEPRASKEPDPRDVVTPVLKIAEAPSQAVESSGRRLRPEISQIWQGRRPRDRYFAAAVFFPVVLSALMVGLHLGSLVMAFFKREAPQWNDHLTGLVMVGCALTLFPQYYFFRPDTPHLTEFMVPFINALCCSAVIFFRNARGVAQAIPAGVFCLLAVLQLFVHYNHAMPKESAGTIAARKHGPAEFTGRNNVRVTLKPERAEALRGLQEAIVSHSVPGDWVVCLPYSPTINFMTDRPSYLWDLYTDNTLAGPEFDRFRIMEIKKYQPAVVVIDHRDINNSEASRFPNWAPVFYAYLKDNFDLVGKFDGNEVFVRRGAANE